MKFSPGYGAESDCPGFVCLYGAAIMPTGAVKSSRLNRIVRCVPLFNLPPPVAGVCPRGSAGKHWVRSGDQTSQTSTVSYADELLARNAQLQFVESLAATALEGCWVELTKHTIGISDGSKTHNSGI